MTKKEKFQKIFYKMVLTRFLEETLIEEHSKGNTYGPLHLCIGQEAAGVGACSALEKEDVICTTHRGHAHYIGKGISIKKLCCEIWGKREGYGKGRAGHMIIFDRETGILGGSGIVGGSIPLAVGQALAFQMKKLDRVVISFFGDGASNTGSFHESLNMASKWKLPVIFLCETNQYGLTVHVEDHLSTKHVVNRAAAYDMPGISVFGNDVEEVYNKLSKIVQDTREGKGPVLVEAKTYRIHGFSTGDSRGYQRETEMKYWKKKDPILAAEKTLMERKFCTKKKIDEIKTAAKKKLESSVEYAKNAVYPEPLSLPDDLYQGENE
jgi:pyruvate dehydrogenase E1 component alpha subunit